MTEILPIPPLHTAEDPICSAADMRQRWRALMGTLGFGEHLLWLGFVGPDRRMYKTLSQVPIGRLPNGALVENVMSRLAMVLEGLERGTTLALLLTRPDSGPVSEQDRRWGAILTETARRFGVTVEPIFRANDESLVQL